MCDVLISLLAGRIGFFIRDFFAFAQEVNGNVYVRAAAPNAPPLIVWSPAACG
jgi:hypothetical protein